MKMNSYSAQKTAIKLVFISLFFLLSGVLLTSGSVAAENCAMNSSQNAHTSSEISNVCTACCGLGDSQCLCHTQGSQPVEMPKVVWVSGGGFHSDHNIQIGALLGAFDGIPYPRGGPTFPFSKKAVSPPLFLWKQSFII